MAKGNPSFLNGLPELLVLQLLSRRAMYGYEIVRAIQEKSEKAFTFGEGCIYPYLHYLEKSKFISSEETAVDGRSRRYYRVTQKGARRLEELSGEWQRVVRGTALILGGAHG